MMQLQSQAGNAAVLGLIRGPTKSPDAGVGHSAGLVTLQREWIKDEASGRWTWNGDWNDRLLGKSPTVSGKKFQAPPSLTWTGDRYQSSGIAHEFQVVQADAQAAKKRLPLLRFWKSEAEEMGLKESAHYVQQIVETIEDADKDTDDTVLFATVGSILAGVALYNFDGTLEGASNPPEQDQVSSTGKSRWLYLVFAAANPWTQMPPSQRKVGSMGGGGSAMSAYLTEIAGSQGLPIYQHAGNPGAYLAALKQGWVDVYAERDGFHVPQV